MYRFVLKPIIVLTIFLFWGFLMIVLFQLFFDYQMVDFYKSFLHEYNTEKELTNNTDKTILAMGDSFTAGNGSWPGYLKRNLPHYRVINSGVGGTEIPQTLASARKRFTEFKPDIFIYQIYIGNDLAYKNPLNWKKLSLARNLWWILLNRFPVLQIIREKLVSLSLLSFLNYSPDLELTTITGNEKGISAKKDNTEIGGTSEWLFMDKRGIDTSRVFSPEKYNSRIRLYLGIDPYMNDEQVTLTGFRGNLYYESYREKLRELLDFCMPGQCKAVLMVIPQKSQVTDQYYEQYLQIGQKIKNRQLYQNHNYPFYQQLVSDFSSENVIFINFHPVIKQYEETFKENLYFANDIHMNEKGQKLIYKTLIQFLEKHQMLEEKN